MRIIAFIENPDVIKKILKHLGLWDMKQKPRPTGNAPPIDIFPVYDEHPEPRADDYIIDPEYSAEAYFLKNHSRIVRLPMPKIPAFNFVWRKMPP